MWKCTVVAVAHKLVYVVKYREIYWPAIALMSTVWTCEGVIVMDMYFRGLKVQLFGSVSGFVCVSLGNSCL